MPKREPDLLIEDILGSIAKIERYTLGMDKKQFQADEKTLDAVVRNLEIIGEAVRQLPADFTGRYPEVSWRQISGLRNRIVHDYFGLDLDLIWEITLRDLPALKTRIRSLDKASE